MLLFNITKKVYKMTRLKRIKKSSISFADSPSLTEQHHQEYCSIQNIVNRSKQGLPYQINPSAHYASLEDVPDYFEAQIAIAHARQTFDSIPASIRAHFNNDLGSYLDFVTDEANYDAIADLGLSNAHLKPPEAVSTPPTPPPLDPPSSSE